MQLLDSLVQFLRRKAGITELRESLAQIKKEFQTMKDAFKKLHDQVEADTAVKSSAVLLLTDLKTKLDAAIAENDPAALEAFSAQLGDSTAALAAALVANTPAAAAAV